MANPIIDNLQHRAALYDKALAYLRGMNPLTLDVLIEALRIADMKEMEQPTRATWSMAPFKEEMREELIRVLEKGKRAFQSLPAEGSQPAAQQQPRPQADIDDSHTIASYANFCRVTGTPEELIIDFGLNPQPFGIPNEPIPVTQRIITNFYTAKRMLHALNLTIQRHEGAFGVLEVDVQKRVRPGVR